ncbi:MAG: HEWD family protein [Halolamina sp.]
MSPRIRKPERRACKRCERVERLDEAAATWRVAEVGSVHCPHEWDINGSFVPILDTSENEEGGGCATEGGGAA